MSLPTSQRRALNQIEKALADDYPSLGPLFGIFARLTDREAMPVTERIAHPPRPRRMRPVAVTLVGLAMVAGALFILSLRLSATQACSGTTTAAIARVQYVPAEHQPACTSPRNQPGKAATSPAAPGPDQSDGG
jgi:hypothetical protein